MKPDTDTTKPDLIWPKFSSALDKCIENCPAGNKFTKCCINCCGKYEQEWEKFHANWNTYRCPVKC